MDQYSDIHLNLEEKENLDKVWLDAARSDFMLFVRGLYTMGANGEISFDDAMAPFQLDFFRSLAPNIEAVREGRKPHRRRYWLERTKKSSKDTDIAAVVVWLIAFAERPILVQVCASNRSQAGIVEDRVVQLLHYNKWLNDYVEVITGVIRSRTMPRAVTARIEATSTGAGAQGPTPDLLVLNELVHVDKWSVMDAHMNNADGVPNGIVIVSTNAGIKGSPAHVWRTNAQGNPDRWECHIWSKKAPWLSDADMEDARRRDPIGKEFARLWRGLWVSGMGDAVEEALIDAAFCLKGPHLKRRERWRYIGGLDLGISHDHAGLAYAAVDTDRQVTELARAISFRPSIPNDRGVLEVDISAVREAAESFSKFYGVEWMGYDPAAGGSFLAQDLRRKGIPMAEMSFGNRSNTTAMAQAFVQVMKAGRFKTYEDEHGAVRRDFGKFSIDHRPPSTYILRSTSDEFGHADVGTAIAILLPRAMSMMGFEVGRLLEGDSIYEDYGTDLTEYEYEAMPQEFKDLLESEDFGPRPKHRSILDDFEAMFGDEY